MIKLLFIASGWTAAGAILTSGFFFLHILAFCLFFGLDLDFVLQFMFNNISDGVTTTIGVGDIEETRQNVINVTRTIQVDE